MKKNIKLKPAGPMSYVVGGSLGLLFVLTLAMLLPATHHTALATCATGDSSELCVSSQAATELSVNLQTAISVALENQVNLEITPTSSGATGYSSAKLSVSTNSNEGYGIFLSTSTPSGDLLSTSSNNEAVINNTSLSNVPLTSLAKNSYGYALDSTPTSDTTKYSHIPTASTAVRTTNSVTASGEDYAYGDTYYLSFGAKIGTDIPAGSYSGAVTVSAVANPRTIAYLSDLTYMQDMTSDICMNTREGYTKQLIDTRDGKSYWVAKLKDGNCWMTQNLALTFGADEGMVEKITYLDSDLPNETEWKPEATEVSSSATVQGTDQDEAKSWNIIGLEVGNQWYYQFNAATAETCRTASFNGGAASGSICPKGWTMPLAGAMNDDKTASFYKLTEAYGVDSGQDMIKEPFNFVLGGRIWSGRLDLVGASGYYWSRTPSYEWGYSFSIISAGGINTSYSIQRANGFSVRCVAR